MPTSSPKFKLNVSDFIKSFLTAALSQPFVIILSSLSAGKFDINWTEMWHLAVASAAGYLLKNFFTGPSGANPPKNLVIIGLLLISSVGFGQSIFKPLPAYHKPVRINGLFKSIGPTDSLPDLSTGKFQGFRFAGPDLAFAIPDFSVYTGLGIDYVWATANTSTGKWEYDYTIGPRVYGGADLGTPTVKAIGAVGIRMTFFKGWLAVGAIYNLTTKKPQATIGNPAALIPGLN